ncbi:hypothetical protein B0O80DRAFT_112907 [Mortierella sp. GBAus27b]|nr:hypothetical protein B0O80DRAFT_112907 [Mortierella sp. GBAus27b]
MAGPSSIIVILGLPHLLDNISAQLDHQDLKNCASCCRTWHSYFGPYRFRYVRVDSGIRSQQSSRMVFEENSHHIRELELEQLTKDYFNMSRCTGLRKLTLAFQFDGDDDLNELYEVEDENEDEDYDFLPLDIQPASEVYHPARVAKLMQQNEGLQELMIAKRNTCLSFPKPMLEATKGLPFLIKIEILNSLHFLTVAKLLNHLPRQLQELHVLNNIHHVHDDEADDSRCDYQLLLLQSNPIQRALRRLVVRDKANCLAQRMFVPFLRQCPRLEELSRGSRPWSSPRFCPYVDYPLPCPTS